MNFISANTDAVVKFFTAHPTLTHDLADEAVVYEQGGNFRCITISIDYYNDTHVRYRMSTECPFITVKKDGKYLVPNYFEMPECVLDTLCDDSPITAIHALDYCYEPYVSEYYGELPHNIQYREYSMDFYTSSVKNN